MKRRMLLGIAVLVLAFCALPALAAPADSAGDAALAAVFAPAPTPDLGLSSQPQGATLLPRVTPKTACTATAACSPSGSVSCTGTTECFQVSKCYASCDGILTWCPHHG